jgi:hypothetical protein
MNDAVTLDDLKSLLLTTAARDVNESVAQRMYSYHNESMVREELIHIWILNQDFLPLQIVAWLRKNVTRKWGWWFDYSDSRASDKIVYVGFEDQEECMHAKLYWS